MSAADALRPMDLEDMTDTQLATVVAGYGWDSPWYGSGDERTPETELRRRYPYLRGLHEAWVAGSNADWVAAGRHPMRVFDTASAGTVAVLAAYVAERDRLLAPRPTPVDRVRQAGPDHPDSYYSPDHFRELDIAAARHWLRDARDYLRSVLEHAADVAREAAAAGRSETSLQAGLGVSRDTVRGWLGKYRANRRPTQHETAPPPR